MFLLILGFIILLIAIMPYIIYTFGIYFGKKPLPLPTMEVVPNISILIPAYNEAAVIKQRIKNIRESDYPSEKYEIIVIDDCSSDQTYIMAEEALREADVDHTVLMNSNRMGQNWTINRAIQTSRNEIIVTTDADVFFDTKALHHLITRLMSDKNIAAVCGDLRPKPQDTTHTSMMEAAYRNIYGRMCAWESAVDSTYNFNGGLLAFKKEYINRIEDRKGANDANTAFGAIRQNLRTLYEIKAIVYEDIPESFLNQYNQKQRRATHLIEATLNNLDLLKEQRPFSRIFYPLRIFMYLISPSLFFIGSILFLTGLYLTSPLIAFFLIAAFITISLFWKSNLITAFVTNQIYLLRGLLNLGKDMRIWESTSKKE